MTSLSAELAELQNMQKGLWQEDIHSFDYNDDVTFGFLVSICDSLIKTHLPHQKASSGLDQQGLTF